VTTDNTIEADKILSDPLQGPDEYCSECHGTTSFMFDKKLGYYKWCPHCGSIQYLHRRFLRFDRKSRQWK
jgi:hypothetical protein